MFPGLPTCLRGGLQFGDIDEDVQGRVLTRGGTPCGVWYDDTTDNLPHWLALGRAKYEPTGQKVLVCVPPGRPEHHYPEPVISVYEAYAIGMGVPPSEYLPIPSFTAYCVQWRWPGTAGTRPPTLAARLRLLNLVRDHDPELIFLF